MVKQLGLILVVILAACQQTPAANTAPTALAFPTMTPGRVIDAPLQPMLRRARSTGGLSNPATAIALANRPTPTPDYQRLPHAGRLADARRRSAPANARLMDDAIATFLSDGGTAANLETALRDGWNVLGGQGVVRGDVDLTGEGSARSDRHLHHARRGRRPA